MELSVQVREVLRGPLDIATAVSSDDSDIEPSRPVEVPCPPQSFADPAPTQAAPAEHEQQVKIWLMLLRRWRTSSIRLCLCLMGLSSNLKVERRRAKCGGAPQKLSLVVLIMSS